MKKYSSYNVVLTSILLSLVLQLSPLGIISASSQEKGADAKPEAANNAQQQAAPEVNPETKSEAKPETKTAEAAAAETAPAPKNKSAIKAARTNVNAGASAVIECVSGPVNPSETDVTFKLPDGKSVEAILSPKTRFYPEDYMPCEGDTVIVSYAELGSVRKRNYIYSIEFVKENKTQDESEKNESKK
ncbi:MAG: hypothetical protein QMC67_04280 [Candidatus Wallbacteria bacterium]